MKKAGLALAYLGFLVACVEVAMQAFYYVTVGQSLLSRAARPIWVPNEHSGYGVRPGLAIDHNTREFRTRIYTNSRGFRVSAAREEYAPEKAPETLRVMLLGPSYAFGWGVDHEATFAVRLGELLEDGGYARGRRVEVINAGVPALGPADHLEWYRREGIELRPDLVVQLIYRSMTSMVPAVDARPMVVDARGYLVPQDASWPHRIRGVAKQSALVFYGWTVYTAWQSRRTAAPEEATPTGPAPDLRFDRSDPSVAAALAFYEDLGRTVGSAGAGLLVVYFPLAYVIHPEDMPRWSHLGVVDVEAQVAFDRDFCDHLARTGIDCYDATPDLLEAAAAQDERLYYYVDIHWTPRGNAVMADLVSRRLLARREAQP